MFGRSNNTSSNIKSVAKTVKIAKDSSGAPAVSLAKIEQDGSPSLRKKSEAVTVSLSKKNLGGVRAQVVVVLDHSGSMYGDYQSGDVQNIVERFLAFGLTIDLDGTVPVIPFDSRVKPTVDVNLGNYQNIVANQIFKPRDMGTTNLAEALREVRKIAEKSDDPIFCAVITDGEPDYRNETTEVVVDLARYPVFIKFLAVRPVRYLQELDDLDDSKRLLDNVDAKSYTNITSVSDEDFANDMVDEWDSWTTAAKAAGILTEN